MADRELKFVCAPSSDRLVIASLDGRCARDGQFQSNYINSIYFDTLNWEFADEKAASDYLKTKVRIRWYESAVSKHTDTSRELQDRGGCFLEVKRKIGSTRRKSRTRLEIAPALLKSKLRQTQTLRMLQREVASLAPELSNVDLMPKIQVRYLRHRYVDRSSGSRVAYDSGITGACVAAAPSERFLVRLDQSVLEVKGGEQDLPINLRFLNAPYLRKAAFSKYYECYRLLTLYQQ